MAIILYRVVRGLFNFLKLTRIIEIFKAMIDEEFNYLIAL